MTTSSRARPARAARAPLTAGPAALLAAVLLAACAGAQRPAEAPPEGAPPAAAASAAAPEVGSAAPAAGAEGGVATPPAAQKVTPEAEQRARAAFAEGVKLEGAGDLPGAVSAFDRAAGLDPALAWASFDAGLLRERQGDDAGAVRSYEQAIAARPDFSPAAQNLARLWVRQGKIAEAEKGLRERLARADGVALRVGLAEVLLAAGDLDGAEAESRAALKEDERNVGAMVVLATTYGRKKRFELARMVLENARQVDGSDPAVWNRLGFVELALGNRVQAIDDFKTAAALRPDYPEAHANYGAMLADADDFAGAAHELELAVKYAPRSAAAWLDLGNAYRGLQQFEKAEQAYRKALELSPGLNDANFDLAVLYLDVEKPGLPTLQRLEEGVRYFDAYERQGGVEPRVAAYRKDAAREIDREQKRLAREEKDRVRKEAEAKRKAEEDARQQAEAARAAKEAADAAAAAQPAAPATPAATPAAPGEATPAAPATPAGPGGEVAPPAAAPPGTPPAPPAPGKLGEERGDK